MYSLKEFSQEFHFHYSTVRRYYQKGLRNGKLLEAVKKASKHGMTINGVFYSSGTEAAKVLGIPTSTLYKWSKDEVLEEKIKRVTENKKVKIAS